jgi:hypothetical protein
MKGSPRSCFRYATIHFVIPGVVAVFVVACSGASTAEFPGDAGGGDGGGSSSGSSGGTSSGGSGGTSSGGSSGTSSGGDGGTAPDAAAGPDAATCSSTLSPTLTGTYGRLDGTVSALVAPSAGQCQADPAHLHVQVRVGADTFDVAVPLTFTDAGSVEGLYEKDAHLAGPTWLAGWHEGGSLDYVKAGVSSTDFAMVATGAALQRLTAALPVGTQVSVYGTVYASHDGLNGIFRNDGVTDGAVAVPGTGGDAHFFFIRKSTQTF